MPIHPALYRFFNKLLDILDKYVSVFLDVKVCVQERGRQRRGSGGRFRTPSRPVWTDHILNLRPNLPF